MNIVDEICCSKFLLLPIWKTLQLIIFVRRFLFRDSPRLSSAGVAIDIKDLLQVVLASSLHNGLGHGTDAGTLVVADHSQPLRHLVDLARLQTFHRRVDSTSPGTSTRTSVLHGAAVRCLPAGNHPRVLVQYGDHSLWGGLAGLYDGIGTEQS